MYPEHWAKFIQQHDLVGRQVYIPEENDLSGLGAELELFGEELSRKEAEEFYPGIAVASEGFIPVAQCLIGSGDPYFINSRDGFSGPLYRVYHDAVAGKTYDRSKAVAIVLTDYTQLLSFIDE